jgi:hypothetical protein
VTSSVSDAISARIPMRTGCCKRLNVKLASGLVQRSHNFPNLVHVSLDGPPSSRFSFSLLAKTVGGNQTSSEVAMFFPNEFVVSPRSWSIPLFATLVGSHPSGLYEVSIELGLGSASDDVFEVWYSTSPQFVIQESLIEPPTPEVSSVSFSADGTVVSVSFSSATDCGSEVREFICSKVISFVGSSESLCKFSDASTLVISAAGSKHLVVGAVISIVPGTVRAQCLSSNSSWCRSWSSIAPLPIEVKPPTSPIAPVVVIRAPTTSGPCDTPQVDLSLSRGGSGREWSSFRITVSSSKTDELTMASLSSVAQYFASKTVLHTHSPMTLPRGLLCAGSEFSFEVQLCNFLGPCGVSTHVLEVAKAAFPTLQVGGEDF